MSKKLMSLYLVGILMLAAASFFINGCSNDTPVSPSADAVQPSEIPLATLNLRGLLNNTVQLLEPLIVTVAEDIDNDLGGEISILRSEITHVFSVQPDAIPADTVITVVVSKQLINGKPTIVFEFGPDGLVFSVPSRLNVNMADLNANASTARIYYLSPRTNQWELQESKSVADGHVIFDISHFSKYAISD